MTGTERDDTPARSPQGKERGEGESEEADGGIQDRYPDWRRLRMMTGLMARSLTASATRALGRLLRRR